MPGWVRIVAVLMVLWTAGAAQRAVATFDAVEECGDDEHGCDCSTCALPCGCCPLRPSLPLPASPGLQSTDVAGASVFGPLDEPVVAVSAADIFHPPKA